MASQSVRSRILSRCLCAVSCALAFSASQAHASVIAPDFTVEMSPDLYGSGYSVLNVEFSTGGWQPATQVVSLAGESGTYDALDHTAQFHAMLAAQRQTNALLWQLLLLSVFASVAALALACFKGFNHFLGYEGSARKR